MTFKDHPLFCFMSVIQALRVSPLLSISEAKQLLVRYPEGISNPAFSLVRKKKLKEK